MQRRPRSYPSDMNHREWKIIRNLLPTPADNQKISYLAILNAIFYLSRTGCQWRALPHEYPHWSSVYYHFAKWSADGTLEAINTAVCKVERVRRGRNEQPSAGLVDSQSIKTTKEADTVGIDGGKLVKGHKRHILTDTVGNMLNVVVSAANVSDIEGGKLVITKIVDTFPALEKIWADGAYRGQLVEWVRETLGAVLEIVKRQDGHKGFAVLPRRWVVERTFAWLGNYRRLSKDYERRLHNSEAMIYLASIRTLLQRVAA